MARLGRLSRAVIAHVAHLGSNRLEHRPHPLEHRRLTPHHDRERGVARALRPPETGASSMSTPRSPSAAAIVRVTDGSIVLVSIATRPDCAPASTPSLPSSTCSTSAVPVSIVKTASHAAASAAGRWSASGAPLDERRGGVGAGGAQTVSSWRARSRLSAIGRPMAPRPMKPTRIGWSVPLPDVSRRASTVTAASAVEWRGAVEKGATHHSCTEEIAVRYPIIVAVIVALAGGFGSGAIAASRSPSRRVTAVPRHTCQPRRSPSTPSSAAPAPA